MKYNKSQIMRTAHHIRNSRWNMTFGEALKESWKRAKGMASAQDTETKRLNDKTKKDGFYARFDKKLAREYRNVRFGRNDWAMDHRKY